MNKRRKLGLGILVSLVTATAAAFVALRPREPVYEGKTLSDWLKILGHATGTTQIRAGTAILEMGTNALPALLEMLRSKDTWIDVKLMQLASKQSLVKLDFTSEYDRRSLAMVAIAGLGATARPALPALIELLNQADTTRFAKDALVPLAAGGLEPPEALLLARSFTNQNPAVRANVLDLLRLDRGVVVNALVPCLSNKDPADRITAIHSFVRLGEIQTIPQRDGEKSAIVHALVKTLQDTSPSVRAAAARALGRLGVDAQEAVPSLLKRVNDPDEGVRQAVAAALTRIGPDPAARVDPEEAAKAGVK